MFMLGTKAMEYWGIESSRKPNDVDVWMSEAQFKLLKSKKPNNIIKETQWGCFYKEDGILYEIKTIKEPSDFLIEKLCKKATVINEQPSPFSFLGLLMVPDPDILYSVAMAAHQGMNRDKHKESANRILDAYPSITRHVPGIYDVRLLEIQKRVRKTNAEKEKFFFKYPFVKRIEHDLLHEFITELLGKQIPTYKLFVPGDVIPNKELFNKMTHQQKIDRFVEETIVLMLERYLVPNIVKSKYLLNKKTWDHFYSREVVHIPYIMCHKVCIKGLRDEPQFIRDFGEKNFEEVKTQLYESLDTIKEKDFPVQFYKELYKEIQKAA